MQLTTRLVIQFMLQKGWINDNYYYYYDDDDDDDDDVVVVTDCLGWDPPRKVE